MLLLLLLLLYGHGMISQVAYNAVIAACGPNIEGNSTACRTAVQAARRTTGNFWINIIITIINIIRCYRCSLRGCNKRLCFQ